MTTPAPTLYEAVGAERAARVEQPVVAPVGEPGPARTSAQPTAIGPWAAFLAAFDDLLAAHRAGDTRRLDVARNDLADLRGRLAIGGVAIPTATRRVRPEPAVDVHRLPDADAR